MTSNSPQRLRPLNVGNIVSAGLSLWRTHFRTYLGLSVKATLWALVPIYGWARGTMISGQIGRLGFQEVIHQPETVTASLRQVEPRLWGFLGITILVRVIQIAAGQAVSIVVSIATIPFMTIGSVGGSISLLADVLAFVLQLFVIIAQLWIQARFWLYDLVIAVETELDAINSISRSWALTQGFTIRVWLVLLTTYLIVSPLYALTLVPFFFTIPFFVNFEQGEPNPALITAILLATLAFVLLLILVAIVTIPLWQAIKAVLYYDLRSRREGFDIQLREQRPNSP